MQTLLLDPDGFSLGYIYNAELHFVDPDLRLAGTVQPSAFCVAFAEHCGRWVVAYRDSSSHCFSNYGGRVFRFNSGAAVAANETLDHDIKLVSQGDDVLAAGNKTLWVVDVDNQRVQVVAVSRGIEQADLLGMRSTGAPHAWAGGEDLEGVGTQVGGLAGRSL
jgi:hypothetical protein